MDKYDAQHPISEKGKNTAPSADTDDSATESDGTVSKPGLEPTENAKDSRTVTENARTGPATTSIGRRRRVPPPRGGEVLYIL